MQACNTYPNTYLIQAFGVGCQYPDNTACNPKKKSYNIMEAIPT